MYPDGRYHGSVHRASHTVEAAAPGPINPSRLPRKTSQNLRSSLQQRDCLQTEMIGSDYGSIRDLRHTLRSISRSPAYAITCIAVIALGVGANAAIFSMVHSVILTPLPYPDSDRLVFIWEEFPNMPEPLGSRIQAARKNYVEWKQQNQSFAGVAAFQEEQLNETRLGPGTSHFRRFRLGGLFSAARRTSAARPSLQRRG